MTDRLTGPPAGSGKLYFVARNPAGPPAGSMFNVNWDDFIGRGITENAPPTVTVTATPTTGTAPVAASFDGTATDAIGAKQVEFAPPDRLVELTFEADRVLSF